MEQYVVYKKGFHMGNRLKSLIESMPTGTLSDYVKSAGIARTTAYRAFEKEQLSIEFIEQFCDFAQITLATFFRSNEVLQNSYTVSVNEEKPGYRQAPYVEDRITANERNIDLMHEELQAVKKSLKNLLDLKFEELDEKQNIKRESKSSQNS